VTQFAQAPAASDPRGRPSFQRVPVPVLVDVQGALGRVETRPQQTPAIEGQASVQAIRAAEAELERVAPFDPAGRPERRVGPHADEHDGIVEILHRQIPAQAPGNRVRPFTHARHMDPRGDDRSQRGDEKESVGVEQGG